MKQNSDIILDSISMDLGREIMAMSEAGDEMGIANWAALLMVESENLKAAAKAMVLAASLAAGSASVALAEEDIPDYIRKQANQTQFARAARGEQTRGQDAERINEPRRYDDQRRYDDRRRYDHRDPYWQTRDMQRRMGGTGIQFRFGPQPRYGYYDEYPYGYQQPYPYYQQQYQYRQPQPQGWYGYADDQSPLDGGYDDDDSYQYDEPPQPAANEPPQPNPNAPPQPVQQVQPQTQPAQPQPAQPQTRYQPGPGALNFKLANGKAAVFEPYPNQADLEMARKVNAPMKSVNVAGQNRQIKAYVFELDDVTYVVATPGQF